MVLTTGMYNKKATFFTLKPKLSSFGGRGKKEEKEIFTSYVYCSNLRNTEFWESRRSNEKSKLRIRVRFTPKVLELNTVDCFVKIDGKMWNILSIENVLERNKEFLMYLEHKTDDKY